MSKKFKTIRRNRNLPVYNLIWEISKLFNSECEVCLKKMKKPQPGFVIHHLKYKKGEKTHRDFINRLKYYQFLLPIIKKGNIYDDFAFICNACHHSIDGPRGLKRRKKMNVLRLFLMYFRTKT